MYFILNPDIINRLFSVLNKKVHCVAKIGCTNNKRKRDKNKNLTFDKYVIENYNAVYINILKKSKILAWISNRNFLKKQKKNFFAGLWVEEGGE